MKPHEERVVQEREELQDKLDKLSAFFDSKIYDMLSQDKRNRLLRQHGHMSDYRDVLDERIANFPKDATND